MKMSILGVGHLASFLVQGAQGAGHSFLLSQHSRDKAADLASRFGCDLAASNQAAVDANQHILVSLPAADGLDILRGLTFREGQSVCSAMAGVSLEDLSRAVAPATAVQTMMPGFANAYSVGPVLLYPADAGWAEFFAACGPVHQMPDAHGFETAAVFGAMSGASIFFMRHLAAWYEAEGLDPTTARRLVAETLRGNAEVFLQSDATLEAICDGVTTPGGITEQLLSDMQADGALVSWHKGMTRILHRMAPARKG